MAGNARTGGGRVDDFSCVGPLVAVDCVDIMAQAIAHRQFIRFWFARLSGVMANQMLMVAVAVAWHMYDITSSAWDLGLVGLFQFIPALLMTLPAGHVADRFHRGRIFAVCMLAQAVVAAWLVGATQWGHVTRELIFGLSVLLGMARAFQMPVQQSLTPMLVPPEFLQRAIAMSSSGQQVAVISGPALGGLLYLAGASVVYATCAVLLLLACALVLTVRYTHRPSHLAATWGTVMAGVAFVWQRKVLLGGLHRWICLPSCWAGPPPCCPSMRASPAMGALLMSLVLMRWPIRRWVGRRVLMAVGVFGLSMLALAVTGAADNVSVVTRLTLMQLETPDEMRGRVSAVNSIFIGASNQLGEFESGATAELFGPVGSVVLGGVGTMVIALSWLKLFPALARRDRMV